MIHSGPQSALLASIQGRVQDPQIRNEWSHNRIYEKQSSVNCQLPPNWLNRKTLIKFFPRLKFHPREVH